MYSSLTGFRAIGLDKDSYRRDLQPFFQRTGSTASWPLLPPSAFGFTFSLNGMLSIKKTFIIIWF